MNKAKLNWITFDLKGWEEITPKEMDPDEMQMFTKEAILLGKKINHVPSDFPRGIDNIRQVLNYQTSQNDGVLISSDLHKFGQAEGVISIFKKKTSKPRGFQFAGSIIICYAEFFYSINIQAEERGVTGIREAALWAVLRLEPHDEKWTVHPYGRKYNRHPNVKYNLSDDAEYDKTLPKHPLSQVRKKINSIVDTISFSDDLKYFESYPLE